ncbi:MAG: fatty acid desaturase family protein [Parachlamydiaceae bacterium]
MFTFSDMAIRFAKKTERDFHSAVKARVAAYFKENDLHPNANGEMKMKALLHGVLYLIGYFALMSGYFSSLSMLALYAYLGLITGLMGFNVSHDALHNAFSSKRWVNRLLGYTFDYNGESSYVWKETHNALHHTFTNITGMDGDINKAPLLRFSPMDPWRPFNRFQPYYVLFLYSLVTLPWVYYTDYKIFTKAMKEGKTSRNDAIAFFFFKALNFSLMVILPILALPYAWWQIVIGNIIMHMTAGLSISIVFQLAHLVEGVYFPAPDEEGKIQDEWAVHEMKTTSNFATENRFLSYWLGGLNFQVEHHLFPHVCHVHYPEISKIVKACASEYQVPYNEHKTFKQAIVSHFRHLNRLAKSPDYARETISG